MLFSDAVMVERSTVIPFSALRRARAAEKPAARLPDAREAAYDRRQAIERLRRLLPPGSLVHVVRRWFNPENDWLVCDFFHIDGHFVTNISVDVALAVERYDPKREIGVKLQRPHGADPLTVLIDGTLSRLLHGEPGAVQHVVIG